MPGARSAATWLPAADRVTHGRTRVSTTSGDGCTRTVATGPTRWCHVRIPPRSRTRRWTGATW